MRKIITITAILTATVIQVAVAADGVMPAALPGPYQSLMLPQQTYVQPTPYVVPQVQSVPQAQQQEQPYWMQAPRQQVPYWMLAPQQQQQSFATANPGVNSIGNQGNAGVNTQAGGQVQGGMAFSAQARSNNTINQGYGLSAGPGYFPGYGAGQQATQNVVPQLNTRPASQQVAPNYQGYQTAPYSPQQGWNMPWNGNWNGPWGGQSFGPWGPGFPTGYGAPTGWGR